MKETIYREDAIKCVANLYREWNGCEGEYFAHKALVDLPSAVIGRVGEWIRQRDYSRMIDEYYCSECDYSPMYKGVPIVPTTGTLKYCPNCGSKMRGEHDD